MPHRERIRARVAAERMAALGSRRRRLSTRPVRGTAFFMGTLGLALSITTL